MAGSPIDAKGSFAEIFKDVLFSLKTPGKTIQRPLSKLKTASDVKYRATLKILHSVVSCCSSMSSVTATAVTGGDVAGNNGAGGSKLEVLLEILDQKEAQVAGSWSTWTLRGAEELLSTWAAPSSDGLKIFDSFQVAKKDLHKKDIELLKALVDHCSILRKQLSEGDSDSSSPTATTVVSPTPGGAERTDRGKRPRDDNVAPAAAAKHDTATTLPAATDTAKTNAGGKKLAVDFSKWGCDAAPVGPIDPEHPQRVTNCSVEKVVRRMSKSGGASSSFVADTKYDGERLICIKKKKGDYKFFSRNMLIVPERKLEHVREALDAAFGPDTGIAFDAEILSKCTFGSMNKVKKWDLDGKNPIRIYIFDVLWINGHSLEHFTLNQRRAIQYAALNTIPNLVENGESRRIDISHAAGGGGEALAAKQLQAAFDSVMIGKLEGLVVKPCAAPYSRGGTHWVKLKKDYIPVSVGVVPGVGKTGITTDSDSVAAPATTRFVVKGIGKDSKAPAGAVAAGTAELATREEALRHNLKLADTLDVLIVARVKSEHRYVVALKNLPSGGQFQIIGVVHDPSRVVPSPCAAALPEVPLNSSPSAAEVQALHELIVNLNKGDQSVTRKAEVVEVAASRLIELSAAKEHGQIVNRLSTALQNHNHSIGACAWVHCRTPDPWTVSMDATIVRLRDDKSLKSVTPVDALKGLLAEATLKLKMSFASLCEFTNENTVDVDYAGAEEDEDEGDIGSSACNSQPYVVEHYIPLGIKGATARKKKVMVGGNSAVCDHLSGVMTSKHPPNGTVIFLLLPLLRERAWQDRGLMGEITKSFGPGPRNMTDSTIARKNSAASRKGGVVISEVTATEFALVHVAVAAMGCLEIPTSGGGGKGGAPVHDPAAVRTALRRLRNLCLMLSRNCATNGVKNIELHLVEPATASSSPSSSAVPISTTASYTATSAPPPISGRLSDLVKMYILGPLQREEKENRASFVIGEGDDIDSLLMATGITAAVDGGDEPQGLKRSSGGGVPVSLHLHAS